MSELTVQVPVSDAFRELDYSEDELRREVPILLVLHRFRQGSISSGKAAAVLECSRRQFLELLEREGISLYDPSDAELTAELQTIRAFEAGR